MNLSTRHHLLRACLLATAATLAVGVAAAQEPTPPPSAPSGQQGYGPGGGRGGMMNPDRQSSMMKERLGLSDDQTAQVKTILEGQRSQMEALRADTASSQEDRRGKMMSIRKDTETKIEAVLTADQKTKYEAMQKEARERMQRGQGGPPPQL